MPDRNRDIAIDSPGSCAGCSCMRGNDARHHVSRREFVASSTLAAIAALLATGCGNGIIGATGPTVTGAGSGSYTFKLADFPALANVGGMAAANAGGSPIALVRTGATTMAAFSLVCPHQGTTVNISGGGFKCPNHGATFNSAGTWVGGQPTGNLASLGATLDATTGIITVGNVPGATGQPGQPSQPASGNVSLVVKLANFPALAAVGGVARVDPGTGVPIGAARTGASTFVAYTLACTHQGTTVQLNGSGWRCPNHGATFDATGKVTLGPATTNLASLATAYDATAGTLTITGTASTTGNTGGDDGDG